MTLRKPRHDGCITFLHATLHIVGTFARGDNGIMDNDTEGMVSHEVKALHSGQDIETSVNRYRNDGQLQRIG